MALKKKIIKKAQKKSKITVLKSKIKKQTRTKGAGKKAKKPAFEVLSEPIGVVTHYFEHVKAAVIKILNSKLSVGNKIYVKGHTSDFKQAIKSMQIDRQAIKEAQKGQEIGLLVKSRVRAGDLVYKI